MSGETGWLPVRPTRSLRQSASPHECNLRRTRRRPAHDERGHPEPGELACRAAGGQARDSPGAHSHHQRRTHGLAHRDRLALRRQTHLGACPAIAAAAAPVHTAAALGLCDLEPPPSATAPGEAGLSVGGLACGALNSRPSARSFKRVRRPARTALRSPQRSTSTGICECVSTCWVSLPSSRRLRPLRPCDAITIRSHLCFLAAAITASATRSDLAMTALTVTPWASPRAFTPSSMAWAALPHWASMCLAALVSAGTPPSKELRGLRGPTFSATTVAPVSAATARPCSTPLSNRAEPSVAIRMRLYMRGVSSKLGQRA